MRALPLRGPIVLGQFRGSGAIGFLVFENKYYLWGARGGVKWGKSCFDPPDRKINPVQPPPWLEVVVTSPTVIGATELGRLAALCKKRRGC